MKDSFAPCDEFITIEGTRRSCAPAKSFSTALPSLVLREAHLLSTSCHLLLGSKVSVAREHSLACPGAQSRLPASSLGCPGAQLALHGLVLHGVDLLSTASCGSTVSVAREHGLGCPGSHSRVLGSAVSVAQVHSLGCPGAQSLLPRSRVSNAQEHILGCPGAQLSITWPRFTWSRFLFHSLMSLVARQHSLGCPASQSRLLGSTVSVLLGTTVSVAHVIAIALSVKIFHFS